MEAYVFPVSSEQKRMWFLDMLEPGSVAYHIPLTLRLHGTLNAAALEAALCAIVQRHEILRTTFATEAGKPVQLVADENRFELGRVRIEGTTASVRESALAAEISAASRRPFDLTQGPLVRAVLFELEQDNAVLFVDFHHIVCDGWSLGVLVRELSVLYPAFASGAPPALSDLVLQYADFSTWQAGWLAGGALAPQEEYWRRKLGGPLSALDIAADNPRPAVPTSRGGVIRLPYSRSLELGVSALARSEGATSFMVLLSAFASLLHHHTGLEDLLIGTPVANRPRPELEGLIGLFVNTVVLRTPVADGASFRELVRTVKTGALEAFAHQELPFDRVVDLVQPGRDQSRAPLFQAMFVLQNAPLGRIELPGLEITPMPVDNGTAKFDLTLMVDETVAGSSFTLEYNADLFASGTAARLAERYVRLLATAVAEPDRPVGELSPLSRSERADLLRRRAEAAKAPASAPEIAGAGAVAAPKRAADPQTSAQIALAEIWLQVLGVRRVDLDDSFFDLGGDSILSLQIVAKARELGFKLTPRQVFQHQTLRTQAAAMEAGLSRPVEANEAGTAGDAPLTPIQRWFFELPLANRNHWNQSLMLVPAAGATFEQFDRAWTAVAAAHDTLRLRFRQDAAKGWMAARAANASLPVLERSDSAPTSEALARLQGGLDIERGPVARATWFGPSANGGAQVSLVFHHLVVDGVSWRILLGDLANAFVAVRAGRTPALAPMSVRYAGWAAALAAEASRPEVAGEAAFWLDQARSKAEPLPFDFPAARSANLESTLASVQLSFSGEETSALLRDAAEALRARPAELMLAALGCALAPANNLPRLRVHMEGHGREELATPVDVSRTLGWFTSLFPLVLDAPGCPGAAAWLRQAKEQLRRVPRAGLGYGLLRYLADDEAARAALAAVPPPEISFNYLGQLSATAEGAPFTVAVASAGLDHDPAGLRPHVLDVVAIVADGRLRVDWLYSTALHRSATVEAWAGRFASALRELLALAGDPGADVLTPADFPLARIEQAAFGVLVAPAGRSVEDIYPLSPMQQGMLFHAVSAPDEGAYFEQLTGRLGGEVRTEAFAAAWQSVLARHSGLRAAFHWENLAEPLQVVARSADCPVAVLDWRGVAGEDQAEELQAWLAEDRRRGFDLHRAPLMRVALIRLGESAWQWVWSHHHLLLDGWSLPVVLGDFLAFYEAATGGTAPELPPARPYRDYIEWLQRQDRAAGERFWRAYLRGCESLTTLRLEPGESAADAGSGYGDEDLRCPPGLAQELQAFAQTSGLTLNTLLQGAWALLLHRLSGDPEVVFGVTVSGRPPELSGAAARVGLFINTLPLRVSCDPSRRLVAWLREIQAMQAEMREYEYCRLVDIQGWSDAPRGQALFETLMVFENYPVDKQLRHARAGLEFGEVRFLEHANYPVTFVGLPRDPLTLKISHDRSRISPAQARDLLARVRGILEAMVRSPAAALGDLALVSEDERQRAVRAWNENERSGCGWQPAHGLFEQQVDGAPTAPALAVEGGVFTYAELESRANRLANFLRGRGVGPEKIVGLCLPRSPDLVVALLAVLKSGGAYLPLDPGYPRERLAMMLADPAVTLIVTNEAARAALPEAVAPLVLLDAEAEAIAIASPERPGIRPRPENLAYVIYTSGSTGRPKGVMVPHAGIQNLVLSQIEVFGVRSESRVYQFASPNFDASVSEVFMAFGAGAFLVLAPAGTAAGDDLLGRLRAGRITHVTLPPSLLAALRPEELPDLQTLIVAGEAGAREVFAVWGEGRRIFNAYGPTECTVCASMEDCTGAPPVIAIGRAMAGAALYILDSAGQPVPPGVEGELYIGGAGVGRGYLGQPGLTAEVFVPDPFGRRPGARLYRTGDLGVYLPDGRVRYRGRRDHQVKIRGFRLELGEIESGLRTHPAVRDAHVQTDGESEGRRRLVAGVLADTTVSAAELKAHLAARLPAHAVPADYVVVPEWPLTPNGKIDRRALLALARGASAGTSPSAGPQTEAGRVLAKIWAAVLGRGNVGAADNFFEIGGDSILSLQIVSRARDAGYEISSRDLFELQTLERVAAAARRAPGNAIGAGSEPETGAVPLLPIQHWFFSRELPAPCQWNQALVLEAQDPVQAPAMEAALQDLAGHHDALRLRFRRGPGGWMQFYGAPSQAAPLVLDTVENYEVRAAEVQASLDLERGPLFRAAWFADAAAGGGRLLLVAHHLIVDAVSWRVLLEDLASAYGARRAGESPSLPPRTTAYRVWAERLQAHAQTPAVASEAAWWLGRLGRPATPLPCDLPFNPSANLTRRQIVHTVELSEETTETLLRESGGPLRARIQEVLVTGLAQALRAWSGGSAHRLDLEGHGREDLGGGTLSLARTVGWFTSLYPVQVELPPEDDPGLCLKAVKEQLRAVPANGLGYGLLRHLRDDPGLRAQLAALPAAEIGFNYLGQTDAAAEALGGFTLSAADPGPAQAPEQPRPHRIEVNCRVQGKRLRADWQFSGALHRPASIARVAGEWRARLEALARCARSPGADILAPSDFRKVSLTANELDALLGEVADGNPLRP